MYGHFCCFFNSLYVMECLFSSDVDFLVLLSLTLWGNLFCLIAFVWEGWGMFGDEIWIAFLLNLWLLCLSWGQPSLGSYFSGASATMLVWMRVTLPFAAVVSKKMGKEREEKDLFQMWLPIALPGVWCSSPLLTAIESEQLLPPQLSSLWVMCSVFGVLLPVFLSSFTFYVLHSFSLKIFLCKKIPVFSKRENDLFIFC